MSIISGDSSRNNILIMRKVIVKAIIMSGIIPVLFSCNGQTEKEKPATVLGDKDQVVDKDQIKAQIQAKEDEFAATYNAGVLKSIGYYADDAVSFYQNRPPLVGKQAIIEFLKSDLS